MRHPLLVTLLVLGLSACSARGLAPASPVAGDVGALAKRAGSGCGLLTTGKPFYRVFRGMRRADVTPAAFLADLGDRFIPAAPKTHGGKGLVAYVPAVPPAERPAGIPDELAIVVYESEAKYKERRETPEGKAYADMHWELFDKATSKSDGATPLSTNGPAIKANVPVDVLEKATDWQCGQTHFYIGQRAPGMAAAAFLPKLSEHVAHAKAALEPRGLDGYIVAATEDFEIAFMHWPSQEAADKAFATPAGQDVGEEAGALMKQVVWTGAVPFAGSIKPGQALNVRFPK